MGERLPHLTLSAVAHALLPFSCLSQTLPTRTRHQRWCRRWKHWVGAQLLCSAMCAAAR